MTPVIGVGDTAPDFELRDQHGQSLSLSSCRGRSAVALVFYPYAFSRVCTGELHDLRDQLKDQQPALVSSTVQLFAVSCDPMFALRAFAENDGLPFPLLSDFWPHGAVSAAYGAFDAERGHSTRSTFVVDRRGVVRWSVHSPLSRARDLTELSRALDGVA